MTDCIFCKIANKQIPTEILYENDHTLVFKDIDPKAPVHFLVIPKVHVKSLNDLEDKNLMGELLNTVREVTKKYDIKSYRTVINTGAQAGQAVFHIHIHIIAGRPLEWPPG